MSDVFRPRNEPFRTIYDAFQAESAKRKGRTPEEWMRAEREAVWRAARDYAEMYGHRVPTMDEIKIAERQAEGHTDCGAKWAYGVGHLMLENPA